MPNRPGNMFDLYGHTLPAELRAQLDEEVKAGDERVKVDSNDLSAGMLTSKVVAGTNVTLTVLNPGGNEQLRISATGGGSGGHVIQEDGSSLTTRTNLNFQAGLTAADDLANDATTVDLQTLSPSPAGSYTHPAITVDAKGRVTAASSGAAPDALVNCDETLTAGTVVRRTSTGVAAAQADTAAHASVVVSILSANTNSGSNGPVICAGLATVKFASDPSVGILCYLSTSTAGQAQTTIPAVSGTNQRLRLGYVMSAQGGGTGLAAVALKIELLPVLADGNL